MQLRLQPGWGSLTLQWLMERKELEASNSMYKSCGDAFPLAGAARARELFDQMRKDCLRHQGSPTFFDSP
jgi:hypothetical protein